MDDYRDRVVESLSRATGMSVSARAIRGGWEGLRPYISLEGFAINDRRGKVALGFERAEATLSWWTLFLGDVRFYDVDFYRPALFLRRGTDGLVYLGDKPLNRGEPDDARFTDWLLSQPRLGIHEATLVWRDEKAQAPEVRLERVEIALVMRHGHHHAALTAIPPANIARSIDLRAEMKVKREGTRWLADGDAYLETRDADLGVLRTHMPVPDSLRSGAGNVRVWVHFNPEGVKEVVADLNMRDARAQLAADTVPLDLAAVSGRAIYRDEIDGFTFATEKLRFQMANGVGAQLGSFALSRRSEHGKPSHVDLHADGIDLKIAATLLDYFPVPRDVKGQVLRFAPRGRINEAALSWSERQPARSWSVKGRFEELGVNAVEALPGVSGLSGRIEGTQDGGMLEIDGKHVALDLANVFRAPLAFDRLETKATWRREAGVLNVSIEDAHFANADAEGHVAGTWHALPEAKEPSPGYVDLKGTVSRAQANRVANYLPNASSGARDWLDRAILAGSTDHADFELKGDLHQFPFGGDRPGHFLVAGTLRDGQLKYIPDWPSIDAIRGTFKFENRGMEIRADRASIFASRASGVSAVIDDLGAKPATLVVNGDVDTTGADGMRFLRESPLVNGPGAFTRAVAVEGPAKLKLQLVIPLDGRNLRVNGDYTFAGATATVGKALAMRDVRGKLSFTERSVAAPQITGTLFDKPVTVSLATQPDGPLVAQIEGHLDAEAMQPYLPAAIAAKLEGGADWRAQLTAGAKGRELVVTSDLKGLSATLPEPLAKPADAQRDFALTAANLGAEGEVFTFALDKAVFGRFARAEGEQWNAAVKFGAPVSAEPLHEGLWLYGELGFVDVDAWQSLFVAPAQGAQQAAGEHALALRGFDLKAARAHFWGRDFLDTRARLERDGSQWSGHIESPLVSGDVRWTWQGKGRVQGRFARLSVRDPTLSGSESTAVHADTDLPAIDVTAERFDFKGRSLGKLDLKAEPDGSDWRIDRLDIASGHAKFASTGRWHRTGTGSLTNLDLKLETENLNELLAQFGYGDFVKRGNGKLEGSLVWPGYPYDFAIANVTGSFKVEAHKGQFAKIDPGAGKLLALVSLQSLPSRATFDFQDVFSEGFAFERILGDMKLGNGVLTTKGFEISGPSAYVSMRGEVSLSRETQDLNLHIIPEVGEGVAVAAAVIGTPVLGLSTLLVTKLLNNPLGKVVAYEYQVTGSWDNPQVTRLSAPPPSRTAANPQPAAARNPQQE